MSGAGISPFSSIRLNTLANIAKAGMGRERNSGVLHQSGPHDVLTLVRASCIAMSSALSGRMSNGAETECSKMAG
eukprot:2898066-Amphidinium_carterae.1